MATFSATSDDKSWHNDISQYSVINTGMSFKEFQNSKINIFYNNYFSKILPQNIVHITKLLSQSSEIICVGWMTNPWAMFRTTDEHRQARVNTREWRLTAKRKYVYLVMITVTSAETGAQQSQLMLFNLSKNPGGYLAKHPDGTRFFFDLDHWPSC